MKMRESIEWFQLNELSAKADNIKHQMNTRIDKEEEERYESLSVWFSSHFLHSISLL